MGWSGLAGLTSLDVMLAFILMGPLAVLIVAGRTPSLYWIDIAIVLFSAVALSKAWASPTERTFRLPPAAVWAIVYVLICAASILITQDILVSIATLKLRTLPIAVFLLASRQIKTRSDIDHFFRALVWFGCALAVISLYNWYKFSTGVLVLSDEFGEKDMLQLSFGRSNYLASMFVVLIPPMIAMIPDRRKKLAFLLRGVALLLVVVALLFTQSRGSLISLTVGLIAWGVFQPFRRVHRAQNNRGIGHRVAGRARHDFSLGEDSRRSPHRSHGDFRIVVERGCSRKSGRRPNRALGRRHSGCVALELVRNRIGQSSDLLCAAANDAVGA